MTVFQQRLCGEKSVGKCGEYGQVVGILKKCVDSVGLVLMRFDWLRNLFYPLQ